MRLKRLVQQIPSIEIKGPKEAEITGMTSNSHLVAPGDLFVAKKGRTHDGTEFIPDAVASGAAAILTDIYDPFLGIPQLIHRDVSSVEAQIAAEFFQRPSEHLKVVGVTGTNGKTTTTMLIKHLLDRVGLLSGLIGSVEWVIGEHRFPGALTTPDVITCHKLLREMKSASCDAAIMEVSSHALDQNRVDEIGFDVALFTNLSQDHLDYHHTMEAYASAKRRLFTKLKDSGVAIFNADETFRAPTSRKILTYGIDAAADVRATSLKLYQKGSEFTLQSMGTRIECKSPLIGRFNVYNFLAAVTAALALGVPLELGAIHLQTIATIPGRLQRVKNKKGLNLFVDFAHCPDALEKVLETLRPLTKGKLITVFGCGGDRDPSKRPLMGASAARYSDEIIVTNDNPRSEDPHAIAAAILEGIPEGFPVTVQLDRRKAIEEAISVATRADTILIAGKGHEKEQIFSHQVHYFDDVEAAKSACV